MYIHRTIYQTLGYLRKKCLINFTCEFLYYERNSPSLKKYVKLQKELLELLVQLYLKLANIVNLNYSTSFKFKLVMTTSTTHTPIIGERRSNISKDELL